MNTIHEQLMGKHFDVLVNKIGERLAGSSHERHAAEYIAGEFCRQGADVAIESFPVSERKVERFELSVCINRQWISFPGSLLSSVPGTEGQVVEAPLIFFEGPVEYARKSLKHLRGKAVVHLGTHIESRNNYRRLIEARPAFLLMVDVRFPGTTPLADGMFPAYTKAIGAVPTVNVAYMDAWRWCIEQASGARLCVKGGMRPSVSQNVIADFPGTDPRLGTIVLSAHHDTQADSPGADDNACGVVALLELARVLSSLSRKRGVRLISFGAEEQLSVGSAAYVRKHRDRIAREVKTILNFDSFSSAMGWTDFYCNGPASMASYAVPFFEREGVYLKVRTELMPYGDHFPFVAAGVPGMWLYRQNCASGRFFHHRPDDDLRRVSTKVMATTLRGVVRYIRAVTTAPAMPYPARVPPAQLAAARTCWRDLFEP